MAKITVSYEYYPRTETPGDQFNPESTCFTFHLGAEFHPVMQNEHKCIVGRFVPLDEFVDKTPLATWDWIKAIHIKTWIEKHGSYYEKYDPETDEVRLFLLKHTREGLELTIARVKARLAELEQELAALEAVEA